MTIPLGKRRKTATTSQGRGQVRRRAPARSLQAAAGRDDVPADSWSHGDGRTTRTSSTRRERILPAAELRALPKGSALLLATGTRPALLSLLPWYDGPRAAAVAGEVQTATAGISRRGSTTAGVG